MPLSRRRRPLLRAAAVGGGAEPQPTGTTSDDIARLRQLGELHDQGILTDDEFAREKARILGA